MIFKQRCAEVCAEYTRLLQRWSCRPHLITETEEDALKETDRLCELAQQVCPPNKLWAWWQHWPYSPSYYSDNHNSLLRRYSQTTEYY